MSCGKSVRCQRYSDSRLPTPIFCSSRFYVLSVFTPIVMITLFVTSLRLFLGSTSVFDRFQLDSRDRYLKTAFARFS